MVMYRIPLEAGAQSFSIMLGDNQYELTLVYRDCLYGGWYLDVVRSDGEVRCLGVPIIVGVDLFAQHSYKGIGYLYASLDGGSLRVPTYEDMGSSLILTWSPDDE